MHIDGEANDTDEETSDRAPPISIETGVSLVPEINNLLNSDHAGPFGLKPFAPYSRYG
ncbi:MAG: hypothetical protein ACK58L_16440 [Planctomycetota bacterium]